MHELSIALSIVDGIEEELVRYPDRSVSRVHLRLGPLSGVVKDALLFSYDLACEGTRLETSKLVIEEPAVTLFCNSCAQEQPAVSLQQLRCAVCDMPSADIRGGAELEVVAFELTEEDSICDANQTG